MAAMPHFTASYDDFLQYPLNLPSALKYGTYALSQHRQRLYDCKDRLFVSDSSKTQAQFRLPVKDISSTGRVEKLNIFNDGQLESFLRCGDPQGMNSGPSSSGHVASKQDEQCRFIFLWAEHTVGPLRLSAIMLLRLLSFYQVNPHFLDFLYAYASPHEQAFRSSLETHIAFAQWATSEWRWNVRFLEQGAEDLTLSAALINEKSHIESLDPGSLGSVQRWEEKTNDTIMAMESNANIMKLLQRFYRDLVKDDDFPSKARRLCQQAAKSFCLQLDELICETQMQISRAKVLIRTVADRKTILIQHLQTQSALISSKLTASMYDQADRSAVEAIAVRIVTIVTLIYLPATFSSTFFSTDVVKYQDGEVFSQIALDRFLQVTLPLMFLTFVPAGIWFCLERRRRAKRSHETKGYFTDFFSQDTDSSTH
ncbi:hypothetical protein CGCS363_v002438 [Colletotrichum siamense]|uniref:uncharacterized protein n=1 Tax=Colletotrichum siamense TaxID=690259 RepID=UPI001872A626|nr:uncharacterized protein CGCS363_v002438 [Colletotrichum siamense]KAF5511302.1 hypothetical protein CGCS363_v002438 [Colletotrichum siamense]